MIGAWLQRRRRAEQRRAEEIAAWTDRLVRLGSPRLTPHEHAAVADAAQLAAAVRCQLVACVALLEGCAVTCCLTHAARGVGNAESATERLQQLSHLVAATSLEHDVQRALGIALVARRAAAAALGEVIDRGAAMPDVLDTPRRTPAARNN